MTRICIRSLCTGRGGLGSEVHQTAARRTFTKKLSNQHQCRTMLTTMSFFLRSRCVKHTLPLLSCRTGQGIAKQHPGHRPQASRPFQMISRRHMHMWVTFFILACPPISQRASVADKATRILAEPARDDDVRKACTGIGSICVSSRAILLMLSLGSEVHPVAAIRTFAFGLNTAGTCELMLCLWCF